MNAEDKTDTSREKERVSVLVEECLGWDGHGERPPLKGDLDSVCVCVWILQLIQGAMP